jgi:hypothetical protein
MGDQLLVAGVASVDYGDTELQGLEEGATHSFGLTAVDHSKCVPEKFAILMGTDSAQIINLPELITGSLRVHKWFLIER